MKKCVKVMTVVAAVAMMVAQAVPASAACYWREDAKGWRLENEDGSYLTNQWYQSPSSGLWYYMGADGYMLVNTRTPDGYTVDADGVWREGSGTGEQQSASTKNAEAIQPVVEAYKAYNQTIKYGYNLEPDSYVFVDIDSDGIPECVVTNGKLAAVLTYRSGTVTKSLTTNTAILYVPGGNVLCFYRFYDNLFVEEREFYQIMDKGSFEKIGYSECLSVIGSGNPGYSTSSRIGTTKEIYDDYNNSFGVFEEISLDYNDTYRSIDAAFAAYLAQ